MKRHSPVLLACFGSLLGACSDNPSSEASSASTASAVTDFTCFDDPWVDQAHSRFYGEMRALTDDELQRVRDLEGLWNWTSADIPEMRDQFKFELVEDSQPRTWAPWVPVQPGRYWMIEYKLNKTTNAYEVSEQEPAAGFLCNYTRHSGEFTAAYNSWDRDRAQVVNGHPVSSSSSSSSSSSNAGGGWHIGPDNGTGASVYTNNGWYFTRVDHDPSGDWYMIDELQYRRLLSCYAAHECGWY